jgi:hypothetical protein
VSVVRKGHRRRTYSFTGEGRRNRCSPTSGRRASRLEKGRGSTSGHRHLRSLVRSQLGRAGGDGREGEQASGRRQKEGRAGKRASGDKRKGGQAAHGWRRRCSGGRVQAALGRDGRRRSGDVSVRRRSGMRPG